MDMLIGFIVVAISEYIHIHKNMLHTASSCKFCWVNNKRLVKLKVLDCQVPRNSLIKELQDLNVRNY